METRATSRGRIVIPAPLRRKLGIKAGTRIHIEVDEKSHLIILTPITREYVHSMRGKYREKGLMTALIVEKESQNF
ncbi:MAG TPA: AbrB/MazE/SpoVT family DNA-binding domain-containing protein [Blastocatellia bacterium]|nr:AbrB/MazE/SpoVT family DNA-binding domain-containing protein [Blastocatellia bacterium]